MNAVIAEHYGMLAGRHFESDDAAARHYFQVGWKLGLVPNPLIDQPAARFSAPASLRLRNTLARMAWDASGSHRIGLPSRFIDSSRLLLRYPDLFRHRGGWLGGVTDLPSRDRDRLPLNIGSVEMLFGEYLRQCRSFTDAASSIYESDVIDLDFYVSQVNGSRPLSMRAALDDYFSNGEFDGRTLNPFFEPEWYLQFDRVQRRNGRSINQFLDFVAHGEVGRGSPHFWGQRYLEEVGGHIDPPESPLAHFTSRAPGAVPTPACEGVGSISKSAAAKIVRSRHADYHASLRLLWAEGPILSRHRTAPSAAAARGRLLVLVDERRLRAVGVQEMLRSCGEQSLEDVQFVVIAASHFPSALSVLESEQVFPHVEIELRLERETFGGAVRRILISQEPDAWTIWTPGQVWGTAFASSMVAALNAHQDAAGAAVVSLTTPQPWLRTENALWLQGLDGAGLVLRGRGVGAVLPNAVLDLGVMNELCISLSSTAICAAIEEPLVEVLHDLDSPLEARAGANVARQCHLVEFPDPGALDVAVSVAMPTFEDWSMTISAVRAVLRNSPGHSIRVVVVDNGSRRPVATLIASAFAGDPRVVVRRMARNTDFALGSNIAAATSASETVVFLNNDTVVEQGWLDPLLDAIDSSDAAAAQPLLIFGDRTIQSAGTVFLGGLTMPRHLLVGMHVVDVDPALDAYAFSALTAACLAVRYRDVAALGGFDAHYVNGMEDVDFSLRLREFTGGTLRVRTKSRVLHLEGRSPSRGQHVLANRARLADRWRDELVHELDDRHVLDGGRVVIERVDYSDPRGSELREGHIAYGKPHISAEVNESPPRLRWAIKVSATGDLDGDSWGDVYFAQDLADALRDLGQEVVIDRRTSHTRSSSGWDDVALTLRGLIPFIPQPGATNLLWVISHPDDVTREELSSGFDKVYAAGSLWAARISESWAIPISPLLQATNVDRFNVHSRSARPQRGALFVGRTRGVPRRIVRDAIEAGADVEVYGDDGWEQFIDRRYVRGLLMPNERLPAAYADAEIVLNDHWPDMAAQGFFSNRLFDAAATGARIVSDPVPGMTAVFGRQVQEYSDAADLPRLLEVASPVWPTPEELRESAALVALNHSFNARAQVLLNDALEVRGGR
ncbi:glycosyltransferase [Microbacterium deminutum]|uniref:Glycosyltransferase n=1 Tax=Microbacterium deminutum TaxID=344164 RepID=A0ABP5BIN0_9MICO